MQVDVVISLLCGKVLDGAFIIITRNLGQSPTKFPEQRFQTLSITGSDLDQASKFYYAVARIMGILSVCPSVCVTSRYGFKAKWDKTLGLHHMIGYSLFLWGNLVPLGEEIPLERGHRIGVPLPLEVVILLLLVHLAWKRLQIDADLLLILTSTADELSSGTNIDDLERPWTPKIGGFSEFLAILGCNTHFKSELRRNHSR